MKLPEDVCAPISVLGEAFLVYFGDGMASNVRWEMVLAMVISPDLSEVVGETGAKWNIFSCLPYFLRFMTK